MAGWGGDGSSSGAAEPGDDELPKIKAPVTLFLSHAKADLDKEKKGPVHRGLEEAAELPIQPWYDAKDIDPGVEFNDSIKEGIRNADLMVVFRTDLGPIEECWSKRVGHVRVATYHPNIPRSGDHTVESCLWLKGPGLPAGTQLPNGNVLDLAPTVLRLLDISLPGTLDGRPLPVIEESVKNALPRYLGPPAGTSIH